MQQLLERASFELGQLGAKMGQMGLLGMTFI